MFRSLRDALLERRSRSFAGRSAELRSYRQWLERRDAPSEVWFVSGMGGVGKSELLHQFHLLARHEGFVAAWIDGKASPGTSSGFLAALSDALGLPESASSIQKAASALSRNPTVVCIDNFESLLSLSGWLRESFLPLLPAEGLLVVIASRRLSSAPWQSDLAWRDRVRRIELAPFAREEALSLYRGMGWDDMEPFEKLLDLTRGLPLSMTLHLEHYRLLGRFDPDATWRIAMQVAEELFSEAGSSDVRETLELLCFLPEATPERLRRLSDVPPNADLLYRLSRLSYVRPAPGGFAMHEAARVPIVADMFHRDPERYRFLRRKIEEAECDDSEGRVPLRRPRETVRFKDVQKALPLVGDASALGRSELARKLSFSGAELQDRLQRLLFQDPPYPLDKRKQELLRLHSAMPFLSPELAAERLHASRATYFRIRKEALRELEELLRGNDED
jgi:hypothetical protein